MESGESWMIGILMLCCATLVPEDAIYDWITLSIKPAELEQLLKDVKSRYSSLFYEMVASCLETDSKKRPNLSGILKYLQNRKFVK